MSLINQMLQDLDARQATPGGRHPLPSDVRALPVPRPSRLPVILGALAVLVVAGGLAFYQLEQMRQPAAPKAATPVTEVAAAAPPIVEPPVEPPAPIVEPPAPIVAPPAAVAPQPISPPPAAAKKAVKALSAEGDKPAPERAKAVATLAPAAVDHGPVTKAAKGATIERSDSAGSPRDRAESEYRKAIAALNQGRVVEAIDGLRAVLRDDGLHRAARQLLVKLLLEAKRSDEALQVLQEGLQGQPAQLGWAMTLARLQVDRGDLAGAWKTLDFSLPAAGNSADYQGFAANLLQRLGRNREAADHYLAAARLAPGDGRWWLGLGLVLEAEGDSAQSRDAFLHARQCGNLSAELMTLVEQKLR